MLIMRRQRFWWTWLVGGLVCFIYGLFTLVYHFNHNNKLSIHALILLILGALALITYLVLFILSKLEEKKKKALKVEEKVEVVEEKKEEPKLEVKKDPYAKDPRIRYEYVKTPTQNRSRYDNDDIKVSAYVNKVGYGPVLEINGNRIRDMRSNTYYRIENNYVYSESAGLKYEISNNRIKSVTGSQLYEISGSNINKVFGGFFISISGNTLSKYDNSERYELSRSLPNRYLLIVTVLLFGEY